MERNSFQTVSDQDNLTHNSNKEMLLSGKLFHTKSSHTNEYENEILSVELGNVAF